MDRQVFAQAVLKHKDRLWGYALQLTRHHAEAEDLLQLTYLQAFERWEQLRDLDRACAWLIRSMHRAFVDTYRRKSRVQMESFDSIDEHVRERHLPQVSHHAERIEAQDCLRVALAELPPAMAQALTLRDVWGFSYEEIAKLMESPIGTVRSRIARARAQMLLMLDDQQLDTAAPLQKIKEGQRS